MQTRLIILLAKISFGYYSCLSLFQLLQEPLRFVLAAGTGTLFLVSLIVLRIYLVLSLYYFSFYYISTSASAHKPLTHFF